VVGNCGSVVESDFYTKLKKLDIQEGKKTSCSPKASFPTSVNEENVHNTLGLVRVDLGESLALGLVRVDLLGSETKKVADLKFCWRSSLGNLNCSKKSTKNKQVNRNWDKRTYSVNVRPLSSD